MAEYLIQDTTLDAIADAINAKTGGSSAMTPAEMVTAIAAIETSGGYTVDDLATMSNPSGPAIFTVQSIAQYAFYARSGITSVEGTSVTSVELAAFRSNTGITKVFLPNAFVRDTVFGYCSKLTIAVIGSTGSYEATTFRNCTVLNTVDFCGNTGFSNNTFAFCTALRNLIIRMASIPTLANATCFNGTPFASGGSGGTIYIPKALYDHLGDGSALDYKAATNWSTLDSYGTITWAQIEGSPYENYYADGTPIPTT